MFTDVIAALNELVNDLDRELGKTVSISAQLIRKRIVGKRTCILNTILHSTKIYIILFKVKNWA